MFRSSQFSRLSLGIAAIGALAIAGFVAAPSLAAEDAVVIPAPAMDAPTSDGIQTVVLSGGCFWGVQGVFQHTAGVVNAVSGYAGGNKSNTKPSAPAPPAMPSRSRSNTTPRRSATASCCRFSFRSRTTRRN